MNGFINKIGMNEIKSGVIRIAGTDFHLNPYHKTKLLTSSLYFNLSFNCHSHEITQAR
jgi:hypothetical protein